jgi:CubicO group peptidase (beta-lactamase class C family)
MTALAVASMVRRGELALDTPIRELVPDGITTPERDGRGISIVDLATHHSGLPRLPANLGLVSRLSSDPYKDYDRTKLFAFLNSHRLGYEPGTRFEYSNLGYGLLGTLIADRAHVSYAELLQRRVFGPLDMTSSSAGYDRDGDLIPGHNAGGWPRPAWHMGTLEGCGIVRSSVNDMLRFVAAHLPAAAGEVALDALLTQAPRASAMGGHRIGLAWLTGPRGNVWHNGGTGGYRSFAGFSPDRRGAVVILSNASIESVDSIGLHLLDPGIPLP